MMNKLLDKSSKLRNLRESVVGVDRIKDDPFASDRSELEQYEATVRVVKGTVEQYHKSLSELNAVHEDMIRELVKFYELNENLTQRKQINLIAKAMKSIGEHYESGSETIERVSQKLDALLAMHVGLGTRLRDRDRAHAMKTHYESKIGALKAGKSEADPKLDRNEKKQKEAIEEYDKSEQLVIRECRDALNTKFKDTDQVIGMYLKYLVGYYGGIGDSFKSLKQLPDDMMVSVLEVPTYRAPILGEEADSDEDRPSAPPVSIATKSQSTGGSSLAGAGMPMGSSDQQHEDLRAALGLRLKAKAPQAAKEDSDNDSDLATPPPRRF